MSDIKYDFYFSKDQFNMKKEIQSKLNRVYKPKEVLVNGSFEPFTQKIIAGHEPNFSDSILITTGTISNLKFR